VLNNAGEFAADVSVLSCEHELAMLDTAAEVTGDTKLTALLEITCDTAETVTCSVVVLLHNAGQHDEDVATLSMLSTFDNVITVLRQQTDEGELLRILTAEALKGGITC